MVRVFIELWQLHREQNHKEKELIIVYHRNERTIRFIKEMFQRLVENQMGRIDNMKEIQKFIIFLGGKNCQDIDTEEIFEVRQYDTRKRFKIFFDDVNWDYFSPFYGEAGATGMLYILRQSNFCWYTSYNNICALMNQFRPKEMRAYQYWPSIYHRVHLTDSLRYTGNIHTLLNQLHARSRGFSPGFSPGTRIVGEKPHFVSVRDCRAMEVKVHELLKKFDKEEIKRDEIAVIKTESWMNMVKDELRMDMNRARKKFIDFKNEAASLLCALGISYDHLEIEDAHSLSFFREIDSKMNDFNSKENTKFSLRGMEFRHVILCVTPKPKSFSDEDRLVSIKEELKNKGLNETHKFIQMLENESKRWEMYRSLDLVEAISRAIASVTIVYTDGDVLLSEIAEQIENASPEICPKNTYNKTYEMGEIIKEDEEKLVSIIEELKNKGLNETHKFIQILGDESKRWEMYRSLDLAEAISRAIASVTIVYTEKDVLLSEIAEQIENASPEICPTINSPMSIKKRRGPDAMLPRKIAGSKCKTGIVDAF
ncbi:hypothetical protein QYM36_008859 [Artemia franciscana]|uniref:Uncharacterized protein n=1 Tax=Artemia franciscana TaxID=6661 RepID=A0AA88I358_ARTSF|nr:hypothetical protein QYM36_008859 [Artemia franciscana]